jgi:diguanylate cyclase (GGDEF)-like protein
MHRTTRRTRRTPGLARRASDPAASAASTSASRTATTERRLANADRRDEIARTRDLTAALRDREADARDRAAEARERAAELREEQAMRAGESEATIAAMRELRQHAASLRAQAADERRTAAADRAAAAADREQAAEDRRNGGVDELTGLLRRAMGEIALARELDRATRAGASLVLAVLDVDHLKHVNDSGGHAAGDLLLYDVAAAITSSMRTYDVAVRWGGDEFVCAMSGVAEDVGVERLREIELALRSRIPPATVSSGIAASTPEDTVESLVARADRALYRGREERAS